MGCDIHDYVEVRRDGKWAYAGDDAFPDNEYPTDRHSLFDGVRSYGLFAFLAGVRNYSNPPQISEPRGLPNDMSPELGDRIHHGADHSFSWLTLAELEAFDYEQTFADTRDDNKVTSLRDFLGEGYFDRLRLVSAFGEPENVRIVFGFDS